MTKKIINIELLENEALVLLEFLSRFSDQEELSIEHPAEERALWNLHCFIEKKLSTSFQADYFDLLKKARKSLTDQGE